MHFVDQKYAVQYDRYQVSYDTFRCYRDGGRLIARVEGVQTGRAGGAVEWLGANNLLASIPKLQKAKETKHETPDYFILFTVHSFIS